MAQVASYPCPIHLLPQPEPIEAVARRPQDPPVMIRRRGRIHRIARSDGLAGPFPDGGTRQPTSGSPRRSRDYFRLEDQNGRHFWVFREGLPRPEVFPQWFLEGES
ncbi:hypothetical protein JCM17960_25030 [Magnetospira thiophila]